MTSVRVRVAPSYFVPLTVTDNEALLFLSAAHKEDFYGIQFPGYGYGLLLSQYFSLVFDAHDADECQVHKAEDLEKYCECRQKE